jgi:hypothetical protein
MKEDQAAKTESKQDEFAGHTPEPWEVDPAPAVAYANKSIGDKGYSVLCVMTSMHHGSEVCAVDIETQMPKREAAANARLIAAAPRLLRERDEARALLEEAIVYVEECEQFNKPMCRTLSKRIKALLQGGAQ